MSYLKFLLVFPLLFAFSFIPSSFGHGLGGEAISVTIEEQDATFSIDISPSIYDPEYPEKNISLRLYDSKSYAIIEHVTYEFELIKDGTQIFKDIFHDDIGYLNLKIISENSNEVTIEGNKEPITGGWVNANFEPIVITGPVLTSGGLYDYRVKILTINSDTNFLQEEILLEGAVSIAETRAFDVKDSNNHEKTIEVISYFDLIKNFSFDSNTIKFSMPFDWNQDLEQLSVVHEEIRVPNTFADFLSTKYDLTVNDISIYEEAITIDDYSFEDRTIHIVLNQKLIKEIRDIASQNDNSKINFELKPSQNVQFPLEFTTPDLRYKVYLSWEPEVIHTGEEITFLVDLEGLFAQKTKQLAEYDLEIIQDDSEIFSRHLIGNVNSEKPNSHKITFDSDHSGTANFVLSNIDGNSLSKGNFIIVIHPSNQQTIPDWIKNNASWWAEGTIDDGSFVQGIQFLIEQDILKIPPTTQGAGGSNEIPAWIKNNAGWWAEGAIDDDSFIQGIQYLIKEGIMRIQN